ncbi:MAG: PorT family protein, partial [Cyclobacteriaceae bacterium]|nr:PorT family protein [Cyclobacteriaceae bacterium]
MKLRMNLKNKSIFFLILSFFIASGSYGQLHIGPKAGIQGFMPVYGDAERYDGISLKPMLGFNAGFGMDYNVNKKFSFYTELLYSLKGKNLSGGIRNQFRNSATYHYLEIPVMARLTWEGKIRERYFKCYLNGGGTLNYWLAGNGYITSYEYHESALEQLDYVIKFKADPGFV